MIGWICIGVTVLLFGLVLAVAIHVGLQPPCPACERKALFRQSRLKLGSPEAHTGEQAYYECLSCEQAFVRYDEDWREIPRDELPSEWAKQARRKGGSPG